LTKESKGVNFQNRLKQFNLDAGWVFLTEKLDFENAVSNFKQTDVDPRELVLLLSDLYETSPKLRDENLNRKPTFFMEKIIENVSLT